MEKTLKLENWPIIYFGRYEGPWKRLRLAPNQDGIGHTPADCTNEYENIIINGIIKQKPVWKLTFTWLRLFLLQSHSPYNAKTGERFQ